MHDDWPLRFRQFALSVDTIDDANFRLIQKSLESYLCDCLGATFFRVLVDGFQVPVGRMMVACLHTVWVGPSDVQWRDYQPDPPILDPDGSCHSQTTYAYHHRQPLWIVARGKGPAQLSRAKKCVDLWSGAKGLPIYQPSGRGDSMTSIALPLEIDHKLFGVMSLGFRQRLTPTRESQSLLRMLARALARIIWLHETHTSQRKATARAMDAVGTLDVNVISPLAPRTVFLASSSRASPEVMEVLRQVLRSFEHVFVLEDWERQAASGGINEQIRRDIQFCQFGVCYLSEKAPGEDEGFPYVDNPNVLFEAGMMQMLNEIRDADPAATSRWIPVREAEELTPAAPFDLAGDRILIVPRDDGGRLEAEELEERFRTAVQAQIEALGLGH